MPTLNSYSRKKRKRGGNASITIMRSGQFGLFLLPQLLFFFFLGELGEMIQ
jgi:hypothetical protein